ncbi:MAG: anhydro-N-acetylmuramic acid kinase [Bacteroidia bacterium]|nr:anhydro-N-acetylmuramic acid kinase [Bacteroidia bacterium]
MAGSSADGITLGLIRFCYLSDRWHYELLEGSTIPYPNSLREVLLKARDLSAADILELSISYTDWTAQKVRETFFHKAYDIVAWHPHTVFHRPDKGLTWSLGDAERLRVQVGHPVVTHFRARDIAAGGVGAPLIPFPDALLFSSYEALINLGGIANLTYLPRPTGYDICPCNQLLDALAQQADPNLLYDPEGTLAQTGDLIPSLASYFESQPFLHLPPPKALDNQSAQQHFIQPFLSYHAHPKDKLHTAVHVIASTLIKELKRVQARSFTLTGGGTYNTFLVATLQEKAKEEDIQYKPAPSTLVAYREVIGFGLIGLLRWLGLPNTSKMWTGARSGHSSGTLSL